MQKEFDTELTNPLVSKKVDVGYLRIDYMDLPNHGFTTISSYELDMASDPHGEVGLFYRDSSADKPASRRICYVQNCPNGFITNQDSNFKHYAYTYDDILNICDGDTAIAECVLEYACGLSPSAIYDDVKDCRSANEYEEGVR